MAWNEPGGSGGKDPWTGRSGDQGPPDLDEIVKKLQDKLSGLFGGKSGGGGGGKSGSGAGGVGLSVILGVAAVIWFLSGIYIVDPAERGVVLRFGKYVDTTDAGPHWAPRFIETVEKVDVEKNRSAEVGYRSGGRRSAGNSVGRESLMLTEDENIVDIELAVQYRVSNAKDFLFNVRDPEETLRQATESALREVVGKNKLDFVLTGGRSEIAADVKDLLQEILGDKGYKTGLTIISVNMQQAAPPTEVKEAFDDAIRAREDEQRFKNEALAYEKDIIPKAHGQATRQVEDANAYKAKVVADAEGEAARFSALLTEYEKAPGVTRDRLYVETVERVLTHASKVLVDLKGGNNLVYLPLDRLLERGRGLELPASAPPAPTLQSSPAQTGSARGGTARGHSRGER
jgi:membrane protease subunit HflK